MLSKKKILPALLLLLCLSLSVFSAAAESPPQAFTFSISRDPDFGSAVMDTSIDDFNALGFACGDSIDISFRNGTTLKDVPYYNGYYVKTGDPLICAYPGYSNVIIGYNNGDSLWDAIGCKEGDTVTLAVAQPGKYIDIQNSLNLVYSNDRADYPDDITFANFRFISGGRIRPGVLYRGASPVDNTDNRAEVVDRLLKEHGIRYVIDLADTAQRLEEHAQASNSEYFMALFHDGRVAALGLNAAYRSDHFRKTLVSGLQGLFEHEGPYYVHCLEGKDRTGFVCLLLEALCGASRDELVSDYMKTYENYYGVLRDSVKYTSIVEIKFDDMYDWLAALGAGPEEGARIYLTESGMTGQEIDALVDLLTK